MGVFDLARQEGFPTQYPEEKTPVTVDVLEAGLILAFVILGTAFLIIILGFGLKRIYLAGYTLFKLHNKSYSDRKISGAFCLWQNVKEKALRIFLLTIASANAVVKVFCSITIGCCLMLGNFGQEWEIGHISHTRAPYRAGSADQINASIGIKLGLRSVNVTLKGVGDRNTLLENETINYNERFWWTWDQGRLGFGPYAGLLQRSFREAQRKGLPIPILSVVEYFVVDGEGLRFGRFYRTAGWYTHILMWTAFATWVVTNIFLISVGRYAAYFLALTGGLQILACIVWAAVRNPNPLVIPFEDAEITTSYGPNFIMVLICGIICLLLATIIIIMDLRYPNELSAFLGIDLIADYDELVVSEKEAWQLLEEDTGKTENTMELAEVRETGKMGQAANMVMLLKRRSSNIRHQKSLYKCKKPIPVPPLSESNAHYEDEIPIYENQMAPIGVPGPSMQRDTSCSREELCPPTVPQKRRR